MSITNYFPLDINAAKKYGIKRWQEGFFWPVSHKSFIEIENEIKKVLNNLITTHATNYLSDLLLINYKIFLEYNNLLNSVRVLQELKKKGFKPIYTKDSINYRGLIEKGLPTCRLLTVPSIPKSNIICRLWSKVELMKNSISLNGSVYLSVKNLLLGSPYIGTYAARNDLQRDYISKRLNGGIRLKNTSDWYPRAHNIRLSNNIIEDINSLCIYLTGKIYDIASYHNIDLTDSQLAYMRNTTHELFIATLICLKVLEEYISTQKIYELIVDSGGDQFSRMLSVAVRNNGGSVTGFFHGEPVIYSCDHYSWLVLSTLDKFITYTDHAARVLNSLTEYYPPLKANQVKIEGAETSIFYKIWKKESGKSPPKKIERIMIVPSPFAYDNRLSQDILFPEVMQLDWELRIINILKKAGCKILYKKHPEGKLRDQKIDLFDNDVEIVYERFEDVMDYTDAFLFYRSRSTTLGYALCTNKPVIYINGGWEKWIPYMYDSFAKRCHIVSAWFDDKNRLLFNEEELLDALAQKPTNPNLEFVNTYMFPQITCKSN